MMLKHERAMILYLANKQDGRIWYVEINNTTLHMALNIFDSLAVECHERIKTLQSCLSRLLHF